MNQTIAVPGRTTRQAGGHGLLGLAAGLLITAAAGVGVWQATDGGGDAKPAPARTAIAAPVAMSLMEPVVTYFLVSSEVQAQFVTAGQEEAAEIMRLAGGQPAANEYKVFVVENVLEQREVLAHINETNLVRVSAGLEEVRVIDLR